MRTPLMETIHLVEIITIIFHHSTGSWLVVPFAPARLQLNDITQATGIFTHAWSRPRAENEKKAVNLSAWRSNSLQEKFSPPSAVIAQHPYVIPLTKYPIRVLILNQHPQFMDKIL